MTKEEIAQYSTEELNQMIDKWIERDNLEFLKQLSDKS